MITRTHIRYRGVAILLAAAASLLLLVAPSLRAQDGGDILAKIGPLADVEAWKAFAYLSGNFQTLHNHPAVFADSLRGKLVVTGNGYRKEFPIARSAEAMKAYRKLLLDRGYEPDGQKPKPREFAMSDFSGELSDSVKRLFTTEQLERFGDIAPTVGYRYFSGYAGGYANHPAIYAHMNGFTIVARGVEMEMSMKEAKKAFGVYLKLVEEMKGK